MSGSFFKPHSHTNPPLPSPLIFNDRGVIFGFVKTCISYQTSMIGTCIKQSLTKNDSSGNVPEPVNHSYSFSFIEHADEHAFPYSSITDSLQRPTP